MSIERWKRNASSKRFRLSRIALALRSAREAIRRRPRQLSPLLSKDDDNE
jgi:hypothetical protein